MSTSNAISRRVQPLFEYVARNVSLRPAMIALAALVGVTGVPRVIRNYHAYLAVGPGGLPYNALGWLMAVLMKTLSRDTLDTAVYDASPNKKIWLEDPDSIPERRGTRPKLGYHVVPARQVSKIPGEEIGNRLRDTADRLVQLNSTVVEYSQSPHERVHDGVLLHRSLPSPHREAVKGDREVFHVHPSDRSMHMMLAPQDAKLAIERNWGERHALSGSPVTGLPSEYVLIYAPRNEEELEVVEKFMIAAIGFMTDRPAKH